MFPLDTHVLLIDDMKGVRVLLTKVLRELGYQKLSEAENGEKGIEILESSLAQNNTVGLVIADLRMPVMDGIEMLQKVRSHPSLKDLPFLILTAESEKESVVKAVQHGVNDYLVKPASAHILSKKLEAVWISLQEKKSV